MPTILQKEADELNDQATVSLLRFLLRDPLMTEERLEAGIQTGLNRIPRGETVVEGVRALMKPTLVNSEARSALLRLTGLAETGLSVIKGLRE